MKKWFTCGRCWDVEGRDMVLGVAENKWRWWNKAGPRKKWERKNIARDDGTWWWLNLGYARARKDRVSQ